ncbi:hypothetical protein HGM15179_000854 [Zosterops borbonicus]|uniref:Uncharacterized protein n=1 Tax=Zosterops borbonicus TaxID=364589 RepID=A0A8K1GY74_9PASS|nr:hypothetical protein HGM15179_000854 [Zosterops borbonicus]
MVFCYVLPPSAYNRAVNPVGCPGGWLGAPSLGSPQTSGPYQVNPSRQPLHIPVLFQSQGYPKTTSTAPREGVQVFFIIKSFYFKGTQLAFLVHPWYLEGESGSVKFQDPIPLLESLRLEQPDSRLMEE